jgi:hypothetical protein
MRNGIELSTVEPGYLNFLNLPDRPGSGHDQAQPSAPSGVTKRIASNIGFQGVEVAWKPAKDDHWLSYYEVLRDGSVIAGAGTGAFFFDYKGNARSRLASQYEVRAVDGDGNRGPAVVASLVEGEIEAYRALGDFSSSQSAGPFRYEDSISGGAFREMAWDTGGYEGRWVGAGLARIGRIWMQPGASSDVSRTFLVPADAVLTITGDVRRDPSADNGRTLAARIVHNDRVIWPPSGWAEISPRYDDPIHHRLENIRSKAGDRIRFLVRHTEVNELDPIIWDPIITVRSQH